MLLPEAFGICPPGRVAPSDGFMEEIKIGAHGQLVPCAIGSKGKVDIIQMKSGKGFLVKAHPLRYLPFAAEENSVQCLDAIDPAGRRAVNRGLEFALLPAVMDDLAIDIRRPRVEPARSAKMCGACDSQQIAMFQ